MIRFIDLRNYEEDLAGYRFTFFDTVTDSFLSDDIGGQAWYDWMDFEGGFKDHPELIQRCRGLSPKWVDYPSKGM